jgi:hypothetical protein
MRSSFRAVVVAVALLFAIPVMPAIAQSSKKADKVSWTTIPLQKVPLKVVLGERRLFPNAKIIRVEQSGTGDAALYRFKLTGKKKDSTFTAEGRLSR